MTHINPSVRSGLFLSAAALLITGGVLVAGPLDPPAGPVAPTFKTLSEVEPRIAINATNTPGDANSVYKITQPGSYYLTGNVDAPAGKSAIEIESASADQVSIDLNGFGLLGTSATSLKGIASNVGTRVWVSNGSIRNFSQSAVVAEGTSVIIEKLQVVNCGHPNIHAYGSGIVRDCTVEGGPGTGFDILGVFTVERCSATQVGGYGILAVGACVISECAAVQCESVGIITGDDISVKGCRAIGNQNVGVRVGKGCSVIDLESSDNLVGLDADDGTRCRNVICRGNQVGMNLQAKCVIRDCVAIENTVLGVQAGANFTAIDCVSSLNTSVNGDGFRANVDATFINCVATDNAADGFECADSSTFSGCTSNDNGGRGIFAFNASKVSGCSVNNNRGVGIFGNNGCHIENNLVRNSQQDGISVNFSSVVIGNNCNGDGAAAGNHGAIRVTGQANRIDGNNISYADRGLYLTSGGNVVVRNSVKGCTVNFDMVGGNDVGPIGNAATATSPWANIQF
jgi:parallel beta-helix repeat protein